MAEPQQELDQSEPASAFKLEKARQRGSVVRSNEVTFVVVLAAALACVYGMASQLTLGMASLLRRSLSAAGRGELDAAAAGDYVHSLLDILLRTLAPVVFVLWFAALLPAALQARGVFSTQPLGPDFSRLSPAAGLKRILALKTLHDAWRSFAKLCVAGLAMFLWGADQLERLLALQWSGPRSMLQAGIELLGSLLALLVGVTLVFAVLDWWLNHWQHRRQLRMSKRELKQEHKEREGDPRIKARLQQLRLAWLQRARQLAKVRSADVLLTNPTHYAVALRYRHGEMPAPEVIARGAGELAQRMRAEARRHGVPIVENAPLARALFALHGTAALVPEEHFDSVARVLRWVYAARRPPNVPGAAA